AGTWASSGRCSSTCRPPRPVMTARSAYSPLWTTRWPRGRTPRTTGTATRSLWSERRSSIIYSSTDHCGLFRLLASSARVRCLPERVTPHWPYGCHHWWARPYRDRYRGHRRPDSGTRIRYPRLRRLGEEPRVQRRLGLLPPAVGLAGMVLQLRPVDT